MKLIAIILAFFATAGNNIYTGTAHFTYEIDDVTYYHYEVDDLTYELLSNRNGRMIVEHIHGLVIDDAGNGVVLNTNSEYNYISYSGLDNVSAGMEFDTYLYYNTENNYEDDIALRVDYLR